MRRKQHISPADVINSQPCLEKIGNISEYPRLYATNLFNHKIKDGLFKSFYGTDASLFYLGRGALLHAINLLNINYPGNVLVPSYHCGVDIESVLMAGVDVRYYKINNSMDADLADIVNKIDSNTKALLVTHYFGFPQAIETLTNICQKKGLFLIEDCAHALFSIYQGNPLGTFGDISVFSQRKTLPIPDGGALLINNANMALSQRLINPDHFVTFKKTIGMLCKFDTSNVNVMKLPLKLFKDKINSIIRKKYAGRYSTGMEVDVDRCSIAMSSTAVSIMNRSKIDKIIQSRRNNFIYLLENLPCSERIKAVCSKLPEGVCPLFFPVLVRGIARHGAQNTMRQYGVHTYVFGENLHRSLPKHEFPDAVMLSEQILCLPIHQDLKTKELELMVDVVNSICKQYNHVIN